MTTTRMFAVKGTYKGVPYFSDIHPSIFQLNLYPPGDDGYIYEVEVSPHPDQDPCSIDAHEQQYWGWLYTGDDKYSFVYPSYPQFSVCFAYGHKAEEKAGKGKAYRLQVTEIGRRKDPRVK